MQKISGGAARLDHGDGSCASDRIAATVTEHLKHGQLTAVSARRATTEIVTIASGSAFLGAGVSKTFRLKLDKSGLMLLNEYGKLRTLVKVTRDRTTIETAIATITKPTKKKAHR